MTTPIASATNLFKHTYNDAPQAHYCAPGRVNLIGEHTDYNQGFVLPAAIDFYTAICVSKRGDSQFRAIADDFSDAIIDWQYGHEGQYDKELGWVNYLKAVTFVLHQHGLQIQGVDIAVAGNVPLGAGLSSSASLQVAFVSALSQEYNLQLSELEIAQIAQLAENQFIGCNCGIMDQLISASAVKNHALLIDCKNLSTNIIALPETLDIMIVHSNVSRGLVDSKYNERREQCEQVANYFNSSSLREVDFNELQTKRDEIAQTLSDTHYRRARHVLTENQRVLDMIKALEQNDLSAINHIMANSHLSMSYDFEITVPAIDCLVDIITSSLNGRGGARMTGGGFGGCVVALVEKHKTEQVISQIKQQYPAQTGLQPSIYLCTATDGAHRRSVQ